MAARSRRPRGRYRSRRTLAPTDLIRSLTVHTVRSSPGLLLILAGVAAGPFTTGRARFAVVLLVAVGALIYAEQCKRVPYGDCWRCHGIGYRNPRTGLLRLLFGTGSTRCRPCRGHGVRMRWGRRAMNAYRRATYTTPGTPTDPDASVPAEPAGPTGPTDALRRWHTTHPAATRRPRT